MTAAMTFAGAVTAQAADTSCESGSCRVTFSYTGAPEEWTVPAGVTSIEASVFAGSGGLATWQGSVVGSGKTGLGGAAIATLPVSPGETLTATVGGAGENGASAHNASPAAGGYGGGGSAGQKRADSNYGSGGGGGGSYLVGGESLLMATGGGGGSSVAYIKTGNDYNVYAVPGGDGGSNGAGSAGSDSATSVAAALSGKGATESDPGDGGTANDGWSGSPGSTVVASGTSSFGAGGAGADNDSSTGQGIAGAGGGGGYYGGGSGGAEPEENVSGAGGGGSGFITSKATDFSLLDANLGNGKIVITYDDPNYATTLTLKASDNPNDAIATTLTATISPTTATGTVTFAEGDTDLGTTPLKDGTATLLWNFDVGAHTITASYYGDSSHGPSTTSTTFTVVAYTKSPSFNTDSTTTAPIEKNAVAGQPFSFDDLEATGAPAPTYTVENDDTDEGVLPDGVTFTDGVLFGATKRAGSWQIKVTATNSVGTATEYIKLTIAPDTATALEALVSPGDTSSSTLWRVAPDGTVSEPSDSTATPATITANQGDSIAFDTMPVDQYGNPTTRGNVEPVTTSSVDTDTITYDPATNLTTVTFNQASPHVITFRFGGLTNSFTVHVTPTASTGDSTGGSTGTTGAGTPAHTSSIASASNHLATTGSAPLAPLGWALGILGAGVAVILVHRLRSTRR